MPDTTPSIIFRPLRPPDLPLLHAWLQRPHVAQWWEHPRTVDDVNTEYLPVAHGETSTRAYIAMLGDEPLGFIQSYVVLGSGDGWWEQETDPGARGIDQFLCSADRLGQGLGSAMVARFSDLLLADPDVTKVQTDPSPDNPRAIGCYRRAGFESTGIVDTPDGPALLMVKLRASRDAT